jgi:hypothetical protein
LDVLIVPSSGDRFSTSDGRHSPARGDNWPWAERAKRQVSAGLWDYCGRDPKRRVPIPITSRPNAMEAKTVMRLAAELIGTSHRSGSTWTWLPIVPIKCRTSSKAELAHGSQESNRATLRTRQRCMCTTDAWTALTVCVGHPANQYGFSFECSSSVVDYTQLSWISDGASSKRAAVVDQGLIVDCPPKSPYFRGAAA